MVWVFLSIVWMLILFTSIFLPKKWAVLMLKDRGFWLKYNFISESALDKCFNFTTGNWFKLIVFVTLLLFIFNAYISFVIKT